MPAVVEQETRAPASTAQPAPPTERPRRRLWPLGAGALALAIVVVAATRLLPLLWAPPPPQGIAASGRIEGRDVILAPKDIQGRVARLYVDEGDTVSKGQLLAELDAQPVEARVASLEAAVANVDTQIGQAALDVTLTAKNSAAAIAAADAAASSARARVTRAKAVAANAASAYERAARLMGQSVISRNEFDQVEMTLRTSQAELEAADKDVLRADADLAVARASSDSVALKREQVKALQQTRRAAVAQLEEAQATLAERRIVAPVNGTILSRPVEVGDVVSPGSPVFQLVDLTRLYVKVYIPEPDIPKIRLGDPADVHVDGFPDRRFDARVTKIHDQAEFTPKSVETTEERLKLVFGVEITFVNPDRILKPGMPADCVIRHGS